MSNRQMLLGLGCFGVTFTLTLASFQHFSTCGATSHLEHGISSWHVVLYMIVCVFLQGQVCKRFAPEQDPPPNHGERRRRVLMRRYTTATEATSATEYLQCSSPPFVLHWVFSIADFHYGVPNYTVSKRQQYPPQSSDGMTIESQATTVFAMQSPCLVAEGLSNWVQDQ